MHDVQYFGFSLKSLLLFAIAVLVIGACAGRPKISESTPQWFKERYAESRAGYPNFCLAPRELLHQPDLINWTAFEQNLHQTGRALMMPDAPLKDFEQDPESWLLAQKKRMEERIPQ